MKNFLVILFILLLSPALIAQITINVPGDYSTIQAAINAANNGDLVLVADGTYIENINFNGKAITVASHYIQDGNRSHINNTIIDGSNPSNPDSASVVIFKSHEDTTSVLQGFTIRNGTGFKGTSPGSGGGGGIAIFQSGALICDNIIENNTVNYIYGFGGGIAVALNGIWTSIIRDNIIRNNSAAGTSMGTGGGICLNISGSTYIQNNIITNNQSLGPDASGGGITIRYTDRSVFVSNNIIIENVSAQGGGILVENQEEGDSEGMRNFWFPDKTIVENENIGRETFLSDKILDEAVIENNTIADNIATGYCGGIICFNTSPEIKNSIVWGNSEPQLHTIGLVEYSDVEGGHAGTGNIDSLPLFDPGSEFYFLDPASPCIDAGNPDPLYNDVEDPLNPGTPMAPAQGNLRNDMGHCGGPNSLWCYSIWFIPVELSSFNAVFQGGKVNLYWTTATETNNLGFEIQRKTTGDWEKIGFVNAYGTTTQEQQYFYQDHISIINASVLIYRLKQIDFDGGSAYSNEVLVELSTPENYTLNQNFPNPFNPSTTISYSLPVKSQVDLTVYNALGEKVLNLVDEVKEAGRYNIEFNSSGLSSGVYFYKLNVEDPSAGSGQGFVQVRKMILLK